MGRWRLVELDDIDSAAVVRAVHGQDIPPLTKGERFLAVLELHRRGLTQPAISRHLHIHQRQVCRYLQVAGMTSTGRVSATDWSVETRARVARTHPLEEVYV